MPTIVPIIPEREWLARLGDLAEWDIPLIPTIVLAPHPDDETLGAGGLIAKLRRRGVPVTVVAITDGEGAYADSKDLGDTRVLEQTEALRRLGVSGSMIHRLRLPDRAVADCEDQLVDLLSPLIAPGTHLVAPWQHDFHPDHEAAGRAAARVTEIEKVVLSQYLFWTWHRGTPEILQGLSAVTVTLTDEEQKVKAYALKAHTSQFEHADGQPILSSELLLPAQRPYEVYIR
jgi:LmbE family N-acetylglucosaminyl deacetylase